MLNLDESLNLKHSHPFLPNLHPDISDEMLKSISASSIEDLFQDIPSSLRIDSLNIPKSRTENEVERYFDDIMSMNKTFPLHRCFLGGGVWPHYVPSIVDTTLSRSEFYTSYTPYQPEASQGMLQALFEFQSLICDLTGLEVANSSLYDWPTAVGEAARMAVRVKKKSKIVAARSSGPERLDVLQTYCKAIDIDINIVDFDHETGQLDLDKLSDAVDKNTAGVYVEHPNFFGVLEENIEEISKITHENEALFISGFEPLSLGLLKPPSDYGADIAVGEGQPLGLHMNFGGPLLGLLATKLDDKILRQMPGRIIGETISQDGSKRGYTMILQTREQHIRRDSATSNICTNQALCALAATIYLSTLGENGLKQVAESIAMNSNFASKAISNIPKFKSPYFDSPFFQDFTIGFNSDKSIENLPQILSDKGILGGLPLQNYYPELKNAYLFCATEVHSISDIEFLVESLKEVSI